jgi:type IV pilus assembly protein PilO
MAFDVDPGQAMERLAQLPRSRRIGIIGLGYMVVLGFFWMFLYSPRVEALGEEEIRYEELDSKLTRQRVRARNKDRSESQLQKLQDQLVQALLELPEDREIPELLRKIALAGKKVGLEIRKFQPLPDNTEEYYAEIPFAMELVGSFHEVAMFFDRLSKLGRIVSVHNLAVSEPEDRGGKVYLSVSAEAVTYRFLTDEERTAAKGPRGKGKGKRNRRGGH